MRLKRFLPFLAGVFQHLLQEVSSDESRPLLHGNPDLYQELFDSSAVHRQNFCPEQEKYQNRTLELNLALKGRHLNIALGPDETYLNLNDDGSLNEDYPGLMAVLLDEVARRGEFTWRDSYFVHGDNVPADKTWTDMAVWLVDHYDVAAWWWFALYSREALGISFPKGWYDGSIVIVSKQDTDNYFETFRPFSWSQPFTASVWFLLLFTMIITGIVSMMLDPQLREKTETTTHYLLSNVHASLIVFTGHMDLDPNTHAGQLVSFSLSFFAMLMLSAYTANLASFLVIEKASLAVQVNTIGDIVRLQKSMCVYKQSATQEAVASVYKDAIFVERENDKDALIGLRDDDCDFAILGISSWEELEKSPEVNEGCNLVRSGRKFKDFEAGFATRSDAGTLCTSLVRDVIHNHMNRMTDDGFIEKVWEDHLVRTMEPIECAGSSALSATKDDIDILGIVNLGGIFIFHYTFLALALLIAIISKLRNRRKRKDIKHMNKKGVKTEIEKANQHLNISEIEKEEVMKDVTEAINAQVTASVDKRLSRVEDQMSQIAQLLQHVQRNGINPESTTIDLETKQDCEIM